MQDPFEQFSRHPLAIFLSASVPLRIITMLDYEVPGPKKHHWEQARAFGDELGEKGDILLFGGKNGEAAALANKLAHVVAILAFVPGGVECFGQHFEAAKYPQGVKCSPSA